MLFKAMAGMSIHPFGYCAVKRGAFKTRVLEDLDVIDEKHLDDSTDITALMDQALDGMPSLLPSPISLSIPLSMVELLSVKIPPVPDEAVEGALKFRLKKLIPKDINDYSLDYVETTRDATGIQFEVYMFEKETYSTLEESAGRHGHKLAHIEPDIYSTFSYLYAKGTLDGTEGVMALVIWPDSVSLGILSRDRIRVSRSINLLLPTLDRAPGAARQESMLIKAVEYTADDGHDILKQFSLVWDESATIEPNTKSSTSLEMGKRPGENIETGDMEPVAADPMSEFCDELVVQVMRTRDYYTSVLKMGTLKKIELFSPGDIKDTLVSCLEEHLSIDVAFHHEPLRAAALGAALR